MPLTAPPSRGLPCAVVAAARLAYAFRFPGVID
jgi:hypothetical protein